MLSFAVYGTLLLEATKESDEVLVNDLMDCVAMPLKLNDKTKEATFHVDKGTASRYLKGERSIHSKIMLGTKEKRVIDGATAYFEENIVTLIIPALIPDLIEKLSKIITFDETISEKKKAQLLVLADEETLAEFLASVFLYAVNKPNVIFKKITEHNNLPKQNEHFSGRIDQLEGIDILFKKRVNSAINICQTVSGLGGIGKTQLAIEYAYRYCGNFKNCIWFINAETTNTTQSYFVDFIEHFKIKLPPEYKPEDLQSAIKSWLAENKDWLLIFDNLEFADTIKPYLPDKINGRMIITTRNTRIDFGKQIPLGVFDMDEALLFLKKRFSKDEELNLEEYYEGNADDFDTEAPKLIIRLGYLPLALEQAAAYIKEVKCTITKYMTMLTQSGLAAFEEKQSTPTNYINRKEFEKIVTATWNISFYSLSCEGSRQLMNLCAYMAPEKIPVAFFTEMRDKLPSPIKEDMAEEITKNRIITDLRTYSLISGTVDFINVHRLVQEVVRKSHEI